MNLEQQGWLRLHLTRGLGRVGILRLMEAFGSLDTILAATPAHWREKAGIRRDVAGGLPETDAPVFLKNLQRLQKLEVHIVSLWDGDDYPALLRTIHDPPALLYIRGRIPGQQALAVVGSRRASATGLNLTREICRELAARDVTIISGLARGVDSAAHQGALDGEGYTLGVLGCGIDRVYPPENARLFQQVLKKGAILSEYPPGTPPLAGHFPGRNRIISGLCQGTLVVEAAEGSGSLITAEFALEQGREVFAVPGPVHLDTGRGVNQLLKDGAYLVTEPQDILQVLWPDRPLAKVRQKEESLARCLTTQQLKVFKNLGSEPLHVDDLVRKSGLTPMEVSAILLHLELQGGVQQLPGMRFIRGR